MGNQEHDIRQSIHRGTSPRMRMGCQQDMKPEWTSIRIRESQRKPPFSDPSHKSSFNRLNDLYWKEYGTSAPGKIVAKWPARYESGTGRYVHKGCLADFRINQGQLEWYPAIKRIRTSWGFWLQDKTFRYQNRIYPVGYPLRIEYFGPKKYMGKKKSKF